MSKKEYVTCDVECFINYFLVKFKHLRTGRYIEFEKFEGFSDFSIPNLRMILSKYTIVTFNGINYDELLISAAIQGFSCINMKEINDSIIVDKMKPWEIRRQYGIMELDFDHIDIKEVCPLSATLKIYGGRLGCKDLRDLPVDPYEVITEETASKLRDYCSIDLDVTGELFEFLSEEISLREELSKEYKVDLRSKSDAQIAEAVIKSEMINQFNITPKRPKIPEDYKFFYKSPSNIKFKTELLNGLKNLYETIPITIDKSGHVQVSFGVCTKTTKVMGELVEIEVPITKFKFKIGDTDYTAGSGGLHSCEKKKSHVAKGEEVLEDIDVEAFYPRIILNNNYSPKHLGKYFIPIFGGLVARRIHAKINKMTKINNALKIVINGSFGKLASKWSILYAPDLMAQVTITGQLTLLMLIERMELSGIKVVSANTDGIVLKYNKSRSQDVRDIVEEWEMETEYKMESSFYRSLSSRDVNCYIAVKTDGTTKGKGALADLSEPYYRLRSNPSAQISVIAAKEFIVNRTPLETTVKGCSDIRNFLSLRTVNNGGAEKYGQPLGKSIRWYYSSDTLTPIRYLVSGNKVPKTDGGEPMATLGPIPNDIDYDWYIEEARSHIKSVGYVG